MVGGVPAADVPSEAGLRPTPSPTPRARTIATPNKKARASGVFTLPKRVTGACC